jgi:protein-S-isoprenylcysteine O-methyltransferase Ste14
MFPILTVTYTRLAIREEADIRTVFGAEWDRYAARTPRFIPAFGTQSDAGTSVHVHHA